MKEFEDLMKRALTPSDKPDDRLNQRILEQIRRKDKMKKPVFRRMPAAAAVGAAILLAGGMTGYAAWSLLTPQQLAREVKDKKLEKALGKDNRIEDVVTQTCHGYEISLMGLVSGENLRDYGYEVSEKEDDSYQDSESEETERVVKEDSTYCLVSIKKADGTAMPDYQEDDRASFLVSPYIKGIAPWKMNVFYMNGGYEGVVKNGVEYRIAECDNLECFADRGVYLGITDTVFVDKDAFLYDKKSGEIARNEKYSGVNALFTLPLDKGKADAAKAKKLLEKWENGSEGNVRVYARPKAKKLLDKQEKGAEQQIGSLTDIDRQIGKEGAETWLNDHAELLKSTSKKLSPNSNGNYSYEWKYLKDGEAGETTIFTDSDQFKKARVGETVAWGYSSDGRETIIETFRKNGDGTITAVCYKYMQE